MANYDNDVLGVGNTSHPANEIEVNEYTHQDFLEHEISDLKAQLQTSQDRVMFWKGRYEIEAKKTFTMNDLRNLTQP